MCYGKAGVITDHVIGYTKFSDVCAAAISKFVDAKVLSPEEIVQRRTATKMNTKPYVGCGSIRELIWECKEIMSTHALNMYSTESDRFMDVTFLTKSTLRIITGRKNQRWSIFIAFTISKVKIAIQPVQENYKKKYNKQSKRS